MTAANQTNVLDGVSKRRGISLLATVQIITFLACSLFATSVTGALKRSPRNVQHHHRGSGHTEHGIVIDAGSSGTRLWIYEWVPRREHSWTLPLVNATFTKKVMPGLAEYEDNIEKMSQVVVKLIEVATAEVPQKFHKKTSIYLFATAGR